MNMISGMEVHHQNFLTDINFDCMVDREFLHMIGILGPVKPYPKIVEPRSAPCPSRRSQEDGDGRKVACASVGATAT